MPNTLDPRLNSDPDIVQALRGEYGRWAGWAAQLPQAWDVATRNRVVAQQIATDKGINVSGMRVGGDNQFEDANKKTWLDHLVDASPYIMGGIAGAGALGAFGAGAGGAASGASGAAIPTTMGIADATALGLPVTAGLGTAGGVGAGTAAAVESAMAAGTGPATTMGIPSATSLGLPVTEGLGTAGAVGGAAAAIPNGYPGSDGYVAGNTYPNGIPDATANLFGLDPKWSPLLKTLAGVGGLIGGKVAGDASSQNAVPPQLTQLLDLAMQRANSQTPLYNAVNQGFYDMLPNFAKKGGT